FAATPKSQVETTRAVDVAGIRADVVAVSLPAQARIGDDMPSTDALRKRLRSVIALSDGGKKKTPHQVRGFILHHNAMPGGSGSGLDRLDRRSLGTLGPLRHVELHPLAFLQAAEALAGDGRKMDEHVRSPVLRRDETETLGVVEPFDRTETHCVNLWIHGVVRQAECGCSPRLAALARRKVARYRASLQYEDIRAGTPIRRPALGVCQPGEDARHLGGGGGQ